MRLIEERTFSDGSGLALADSALRARLAALQCGNDAASFHESSIPSSNADSSSDDACLALHLERACAMRATSFVDSAVPVATPERDDEVCMIFDAPSAPRRAAGSLQRTPSGSSPTSEAIWSAAFTERTSERGSLASLGAQVAPERIVARLEALVFWYEVTSRRVQAALARGDAAAHSANRRTVTTLVASILDQQNIGLPCRALAHALFSKVVTIVHEGIAPAISVAPISCNDTTSDNSSGGTTSSASASAKADADINIWPTSYNESERVRTKARRLYAILRT